MLRIDTHQHFWSFSPQDYSWIDDSMSVLQKNFGPGDLEPLLQASNIGGTVLVEARGAVEETERLLAIANSMSTALGVVGWVPLADDNSEAHLERFCTNPKFRGVRHAIGAEPDPDYVFGEGFNRGVGALRRFGLVYDLCFWPPFLERAIRFVDRHPEQIMVLDHCAKPFIAEGRIEPWRSQLLELAQRENVYCKLSGLATEANVADWQQRVPAYLDSVLEAFTPRRLMFGSDWPVCTLATQYAGWCEVIEKWAAPLSETERERIWSGTAIEVYGLSEALATGLK